MSKKTKPTRLTALLVACMMLLGACAGQAQAPQTSAEPSVSEESAEETAAAEESSEAVSSEGSEPEESIEESIEEPASSETEEPEESSEPAEETEEAEMTDVPEEVTDALGSLPVGDVAEYTEAGEGAEADADELARIDRAMRAYTDPDESLLINKAKHFYYYEQLDKQAQDMYDTMYLAASDPTGDHYVAYYSDLDPGSDAFADKVDLAFWAMVYDHAELFWLYTSRNIRWRYSRSGPPYTAYFYVDAYPTFEKDMKAFNAAVEKILATIDTSLEPVHIAGQIHNRLIDWIDYDFDLYYSGLNYRDLGHTAYGALVQNSSGKKNCCVCDGYSHAFVYLMQQCGLNACLVSGVAGSDEASAGGHAWSMAQINGKWYELDVTWDDFGNQLIDPSNKDSKWLPYYKEMAKDKDFINVFRRHLFMVSTATMRHYKADDSQLYYSKDKKWVFHITSDCVHLRNAEVHRDPTWDALSALLPTAK